MPYNQGLKVPTILLKSCGFGKFSHLGPGISFDTGPKPEYWFRPYPAQKLSVGFDQPDVTVYKSQPGGSVTLYHPLCHASRDSKMGGFAHP